MGIFVIYDHEGIVDSYIPYLLNDIKKCFTRLVIVANGYLTKDSVDILKKYTNEIFFRKNEGFDVMAYKQAIVEYVGWETLLNFDELVLFNDTFFGPFYPFEVVFSKMNDRDLDFWGITGNYKSQWGEGSSAIPIPEHIQSYFLVIRLSMISNNVFREFWENLNFIYSFRDAVLKYETVFTKFFERKGFRWDVYVDMKKYMEKYIESNPSPVFFYYIYEMIRYAHCPIIKRKNFVANPTEILQHSYGENTLKALEYIKLKTDYDTNMIWENILRIYPIRNIYETLHLQFILPVNVRKHKKIDFLSDKIAVFIHLYYEDLFEECFNYIKNIPDEVDVYITTTSEKKRNQLLEMFKNYNGNNWNILLSTVRGRDVSALLITCRPYLMKYTYVCFVHDKKTSGMTGSATIGKSYYDNIWSNMLGSRQYIENIVDLLMKNEKLGFLSPPTPKHSYYFGIIGTEWDQNFNNTRKLVKMLGLRCFISEDIPPFVLSNCFWCKTAAMKRLFEYPFIPEDFPGEPVAGDGTISHAIERIFPYVAQHEGYYSGIVMNDQYASLEISNLNYFLSGLLKVLKKEMPIQTTFLQLLHNMGKLGLVEFCDQYEYIFIYGAGEYANRCSVILEELDKKIEGYIVSDDRLNPSNFRGKPVYRLSSFQVPKGKYGVVLALAPSNQREVFLKLKRWMNVKDIYIL